MDKKIIALTIAVCLLAVVAVLQNNRIKLIGEVLDSNLELWQGQMDFNKTLIGQ